MIYTKSFGYPRFVVQYKYLIFWKQIKAFYIDDLCPFSSYDQEKERALDFMKKYQHRFSKVIASKTVVYSVNYEENK